jgi:hypothetical protein
LSKEIDALASKVSASMEFEEPEEEANSGITLNSDIEMYPHIGR